MAVLPLGEQAAPALTVAEAPVEITVNVEMMIEIARNLLTTQLYDEFVAK